MKISLDELSTRAPKEFDKAETKEKLPGMQKELQELQYLLYAENKHSLLVILQGMDASGKDGAIKNVFGIMNPMGVHVKSFKAPTEEEAKHDFLWRIHQHAPAKGMIQVFNRSQYEDVLITRVKGWIDEKTAKQRMQSINDFEKLLTEQNNTHILKFYLHISPEEQQERLQERVSDPRKHWKYNENDLTESKLWDEYREAYEDCFDKSTIPWHIVPSDQNWYKEYYIANTVLKKLKGLNMAFPQIKKTSKET